MPGTITPQKGSSQMLAGRTTTTKGTDLNLISSLTQTTTLAGTSHLDPQVEVAQGLEVCCHMDGVGQVPCMALDEGHPHDEGVLPSLFLSLLTGLVGTTLLLVWLATRCHHLGHFCDHVPALAHLSLDGSRHLHPWGEGVRCPPEAEALL